MNADASTHTKVVWDPPKTRLDNATFHPLTNGVIKGTFDAVPDSDFSTYISISYRPDSSNSFVTQIVVFLLTVSTVELNVKTNEVSIAIFNS